MRILIADDHALFRDASAVFCSPRPRVVGRQERRAELARQLRPDLR
jgi:DNA-binding NarL/FixJ family response regulator